MLRPVPLPLLKVPSMLLRLRLTKLDMLVSF